MRQQMSSTNAWDGLGCWSEADKEQFWMLLLSVLFLLALFWRWGRCAVFPSLFPHACFFTAFIALCLMELLLWKHKPAEELKCLLRSAEGQVQAFSVLALCDWDDADQFWEGFCWCQGSVAGVSQCTAPCICLLLSCKGEGRVPRTSFCTAGSY